jgi:glycosyltransferase domain-containing protein
MKEHLPDLTLIIPSRNRPRYIDRIVNYYADSGLKILVSDSSEEPYADRMPVETIKYLHFKNYVFAEKIRATLAHVTTRFVALCAVDDFIVPSGLRKGVEFLNENTSFSSVQGNYLTFKNTQGKVIFTPNFQYNQKEITDDLPDERLVRHFSDYFPLYYAVHRTEPFRRIFDVAIDAGIKNLNFIEIVIAVVSLTAGKHKVLPMFYSAKESIEGSAGSSDNVRNFVSDAAYVTQYASFIDKCGEFLAANSSLEKQRAEAEIRRVMQAYIGWSYVRPVYEYEQEIVTPKRALLGNIPLLGKPAMKIYARSVGARRLQKSLVKLTEGKAGYPFDDVAGRNELKKIERFINRYKV